jgi:ABC-type glycerol-3-phosphate transport system permease component
VKRRGAGRAGVLYLGGLALLVLGAFPLFWMLATSLKPSAEIFATPPRLVPAHPTLENFGRLLTETNFVVFFKNSVLVSAATVALTLTVSALGGYALTRYRFRGRDTVAGLILLTYMFAPIMIIIPFYILVKQLGIVNTRLALVLSYTTFCLPFCLWLLRAFFESIPLELEEAAMVDGAGRARVFARITVPLAAPALVAGAVTAWARALGEFGGTIIFAGSFRGITQTMPLAIYGTLESDFDAAVALSVLVLGFSFVVILTARFLTRKAAERGLSS